MHCDWCWHCCYCCHSFTDILLCDDIHAVCMLITYWNHLAYTHEIIFARWFHFFISPKSQSEIHFKVVWFRFHFDFLEKWKSFSLWKNIFDSTHRVNYIVYTYRRVISLWMSDNSDNSVITDVITDVSILHTHCRVISLWWCKYGVQSKHACMCAKVNWLQSKLCCLVVFFFLLFGCFFLLGYLVV